MTDAEQSRVANDSWDVIVVGGGPPGENVAQYAIQGSDRTAVIVERELVGGECSYWACIPSKALLRPVQLLATARNLPGVQSLVGDHSLDAAAAMRRRDQFAGHDGDEPDASQVQWANGIGIEVVRGRARLSGPRTVQVTAADGTTRTLTARQAVVLATGTTAAVPDVPGLREALPWISRDVTNLHEVPRRMAVIGGGVVACEAATWLRAMGVDELTVIVRGGSLLTGNEPFAGELVAGQFGRSGIRVLTGSQATAARRTAPRDTGEGRIHGGPVELTVQTPDGEQTLTVDEVLVAAGRTPNSGDVGLDAVSVTPNGKGFVEVDDHLTVPGTADEHGEWLYAVGDLTGRALLTHMGKYQARIAGAVIGARAQGASLDGPQFTDRADHGMVPQVAFTEPPVASVGLTEAQARDAGLQVETAEYDLASVSGAALLRDDYEGRAKLVIDAATDRLVGATFVGPEVDELLHSATIAVVGQVPVSTLWHAVPSFPTISEVWLRLLETLAEHRRSRASEA
ncbi:dihydrolipoyl dehydrogenase family protein [Nakamurella leprariae]|uniref:NAD(P)/FAD-dependent oxidoreductase n=1 Tax=Nakamurella leprariae TaxID=2803911 RepID=A0A939C1R2_9ACTN|nr:NAD(P)/FAD-dependent oxidoreductase [Nakamurella leprariae]MBM9467424.1 NAD(P)/FAD-dependent oxidoreductase [Nakamurella leprariae]